MAGAGKKKFELEKAMGDLETIVEQLEAGELTLDKSLKEFEKGVRLSRECQKALTKAEQKVQILIDSELQDTDPESLKNGTYGRSVSGVPPYNRMISVRRKTLLNRN